MPVFLAAILGNVTLHRLTHYFDLKKLIMIGSATIGTGLFLMLALVLVLGKNFIWLMPGLVVYFFGLGLTGAPLARFTLYTTEVTKGTASALLGLVLMSLQAVGIELINHLYASHNNSVFALYCAGVGVAYMLMMGGIFLVVRKENRPAS